MTRDQSNPVRSVNVRVVSLVLTGLAPLLISACGSQERPQSAEEAPPAEAESTWDTLHVADLMGSGPREGLVEGRIAVLSLDADQPLELSIQARGLLQGDHAWDIHDAPCGEGGSVDIALSEIGEMDPVVGPLRADQTRIATLTVEVPPLRSEIVGRGTRSLHVHDEAGIEHESPTVACADI